MCLKYLEPSSNGQCGHALNCWVSSVVCR